MNKNQIKILVAPNSFKECADSVEIATLIRASFDQDIPPKIKKNIDFTYKPISDGGDGFLEVCKNFFGLETLHFEISKPYGDEKFFAQAGYSPSTKTVYIESAEVLGLRTIPQEYRKPLILTSKGMGEILLQLIDNAETGFLEIKEVIIGIGGTGTNDLGLGMMEVFGLELYDKDDNQLEVFPQNYNLVEKIVVPEVTLPFKLSIISDVKNPLLGKKGSAHVFASQTGAEKEEIKILEQGFINILKQLEIDENEIPNLPGAGGGLSAGLKLFFNATEVDSTDFIMNRILDIENNHTYDLVITGEGKYDSQSLMDKGATIITNEFIQKGIPVYFLCGITEGMLPEEEDMSVIDLSEYFDSIEESIKNIEKGIDLACRRIVKDIVSLVSNKK